MSSVETTAKRGGLLSVARLRRKEARHAGDVDDQRGPGTGRSAQRGTPRRDGQAQRRAQGGRSAPRPLGALPERRGRRVKFSGGNRTVINGPFAESKELVAGYWILQVKSMDEAVEWAKRVPFEALSRIYPGEYGAVGEIEICQLFEPERSDASN